MPISPSRRIARAGLAGFAMCGLHPKVFPIAIAAGHQTSRSPGPANALGIVIFAVISVIPALTPAIIDVVARRDGRHQGVLRAHHEGAWPLIGALLLIGAGAFVGLDAWRDMPGR